MCGIHFITLPQVAMVEVDLEPNTPTALLVPFAMHTALLICVHLFSLMLATRLLPELEAISAHPYLNPAVVKLAKSWPIQLCWVLSNIVGIVLFVVELVLVAYVKFYPVTDGMQNRLHVGTGTLAIVVFLSFLIVPFIVIFFRSISKLHIKLQEQRLERARIMLDNINQTAVQLDRDSLVESESVASYHTTGSQEPAQCAFPTYTEV